jgi:hypothetical protein
MNNLMLYLSGFGYLEKITRNNHQCIARIKTITDSASSNNAQDEVWIECVVDNTSQHEALFTRLEPLLSTDIILLHYKAHYQTLNAFFHSQDTQDPNHLICLQAKLISAQRCYLNGQSLKSANKPDFETAQQIQLCQR